VRLENSIGPEDLREMRCRLRGEPPPLRIRARLHGPARVLDKVTCRIPPQQSGSTEGDQGRALPVDPPQLQRLVVVSRQTGEKMPEELLGDRLLSGKARDGSSGCTARNGFA
jgi:hypothetical protein